MELPLGKILDRRYRMIEVLGEGGFGKTFLAQDTKRPGNPICVVKQLKTNFSTPEEQLRGQPTFSSDLYAVGIIALQALTGITPDYDNNWQEILSHNNSKLRDCAPRSGKANRLRDFLLKMSAQDACQRYQSATEALQVLNNILNLKTETNVNSPAKTSKTANIILKVSALVSGLFAVATIYLLFNKSNLEQQSLLQLKLDNKSKESLLDENDMCDNFMEQVYCEEYFFSGERGQIITIEMNSKEFDPYLVIRQPDGNKLAINNDISTEDWNSKITVNLPHNGQYKAIARTSTEGESGKYTIRAKIK